MLPVMAAQPARVDPAARRTSRRLLADRCVDGIEANVERCPRYAESSPSVVTPLNRYIGYEEAATVAKKARQGAPDDPRGRDRRGYVERGDLTEEQLDAALDVLSMTGRPTSE